jgi:hypothetical protein
MPNAENVLAFFSYANVDWQTDREELDHLFEQLEAQTGALTKGSFAFEKWLDRERLWWGEDWKEALLDVISESGLFFIFLSPAWLASKICRQEFEAFLTRQESLGGKRVFVAQIRALDDHDKNVHRDVLANLDRLQAKRWQDLLNADRATCKAACAGAAEEIKARLRTLYSKPTKALPPSQGNAAPPVNGQKLASGDFYIPPLSQGGDVEGNVLVLLRVLFSGWAKVTTKHGRFVFGAKAAQLNIQVDGGRMRPHPEFATAGRSTEITPTGGGQTHGSYQILAPTGLLRGNILTNRDDHVPVVLIERQNDSPVKVSGTVEIDADGLIIDDGRSQPKRKPNHQDDAAKMERMRQRIAALVLQECGARFALEEAEA